MSPLGWASLLGPLLALNAVARSLHGRQVDVDPTGIGDDMPMLLRSIGDGPRANSLRAMADAVTHNQATLVMLQGRETVLENQRDTLENSVRNMVEMAREADGDFSGATHTAQAHWVNSEAQMVNAGPTMADAGKSGLQQTLEDASEHLVTLALSGLTGVRASIPIFILTVRSKTSGGSAIDLQPGFEWLYSIPALICLSCFLALELICDCIPVVSEAMDAAMLFVKPAVAVVIALAPEYGNEGVSGVAISAGACCILAVLVAVGKSAITRSVENQSTGGGAVPARSFLEDLAVAALSFMAMGFTVLAGIIVVALVFLLLSYGCFRGKRRGGGKSEAKPSSKQEPLSKQAPP